MVDEVIDVNFELMLALDDVNEQIEELGYSEYDTSSLIQLRAVRAEILKAVALNHMVREIGRLRSALSSGINLKHVNR